MSQVSTPVTITFNADLSPAEAAWKAFIAKVGTTTATIPVGLAAGAAPVGGGSAGPATFSNPGGIPVGPLAGGGIGLSRISAADRNEERFQRNLDAAHLAEQKAAERAAAAEQRRAARVEAMANRVADRNEARFQRNLDAANLQAQRQGESAEGDAGGSGGGGRGLRGLGGIGRMFAAYQIVHAVAESVKINRESAAAQAIASDTSGLLKAQIEGSRGAGRLGGFASGIRDISGELFGNDSEAKLTTDAKVAEYATRENEQTRLGLLASRAQRGAIAAYYGGGDHAYQLASTRAKFAGQRNELTGQISGLTSTLNMAAGAGEGPLTWRETAGESAESLIRRRMGNVAADPNNSANVANRQKLRDLEGRRETLNKQEKLELDQAQRGYDRERITVAGGIRSTILSGENRPIAAQLKQIDTEYRAAVRGENDPTIRKELDARRIAQEDTVYAQARREASLYRQGIEGDVGGRSMIASGFNEAGSVARITAHAVNEVLKLNSKEIGYGDRVAGINEERDANIADARRAEMRRQAAFTGEAAASGFRLDYKPLQAQLAELDSKSAQATVGMRYGSPDFMRTMIGAIGQRAETLQSFADKRYMTTLGEEGSLTASGLNAQGRFGEAQARGIYDSAFQRSEAFRLAGDSTNQRTALQIGANDLEAFQRQRVLSMHAADANPFTTDVSGTDSHQTENLADQLKAANDLLTQIRDKIGPPATTP